tara:strand:- start:492 stop:683 length:192 start_codon:yes stop_codon:yes gene_type:complete
MLGIIMKIMKFSFSTYTADTEPEPIFTPLDKTADEIWLDKFKSHLDELNRRVDESHQRVKCGE